MLSDKIKEWEQEMPAGIHKETGACRYCGQVRMFHTIFPWTNDECNEVATELCDCSNAQYYTSQKKRKETITEAIEENFGEQAEHPIPEVAAIMREAAEPIVEYKVDSVTIKAGRIKCKLSMTSKGAVKMERTITNNDSVEV